MTKICITCKVEKSVSEFGRYSRSKDGLRAQCKDCKNRYARERHAANPQLQRDASRRHKERDPERYREQKRRSEQKHKEARAAYRKEWRKRNPDKTREYNQRWRSREDNYRKALALSSAWNRSHPENVRAISKRWRESHRPQKRAQNHRRKAIERNVGGAYTGQEWVDLCNRYGNVCLCCGASAPLTVDHVIPIALGGTNDISNLQPLCLSCNCRKRDTVTDYRY